MSLLFDKDRYSLLVEIPTQSLVTTGQVAFLVRKRVIREGYKGNSYDYFDKTFAEYKEGFESRGRFYH